MNTVTIHGNATAIPELRFSASGKAVVSFNIASNRRRYDGTKGGWVDERPVFHRVVAFGALAENVAETVTTGTAVSVTGEFVDNSYVPAGSDQLRRAIQLNATDIAVSLRFATAVITRNPKKATAVTEPALDTVTNEPPTAEPVERAADPASVDQPAAGQPTRRIHGVNKAPTGPRRQQVA